MDAKELMIGDWVMYHNGTYQVQEIYGLVGNVYLKEYGTIDVSKLSPTILTSEILEKNGFERVNGEYQDVFYICDGIELLIDDEYTLFGQCKMPIKYVHQLQHALRLCGIDKEITI